MPLFNRAFQKPKIDPSEKRLIHQAQSGDMRAFADLVRKYERRLRMLGMSFFKNEADCDDFEQDVLIKVYSGLQSFRGEAQFSTWLLRIGYNVAINSLKRRKEYVSLSEDFEILDTSFSPEEKHLREATAQSVRAAMCDLPERFKMCLDLYFFYDMSYAEISVVMDLPVNTIKSHVFRAKKILKEKLLPEL